MTDQKLVDELEKALRDEAYDGGFGDMGDEQFTAYVRTLAETAAEVVEKAHTPTDDEREALRIAELDARQAAYRKEREDWFVDHEAEPEIASNAFFRGWDAAVGGGFRRSEVLPEPSAEDAMSHYTDPADPFWQSHPEPQGEPSDALHVEHVTVATAYPEDCLEGECDHRDEDGEPEDMSACPNVPPFEVCVDCMDEDGCGRDSERWDDVPLISWPCAALRAAGGVR